MATHDYNLANQDGASFRSDLNNALAAIVSNNSSSTAPATTFAHQIWVDTTANVIKQRNAANDAWVELWRIDGGFNAKTFHSNVNLNDQSDLRFGDSDSSNWVAFQAPATVASNVTWTLPASDGTSGQVIQTNGSGVLSWTDAGGVTDNITEGNTSAEVVDTGSDGHFKVVTEGTEALRVDSNRRFLFGHTSAVTNLKFGGSGDFGSRQYVYGANQGFNNGLAILNYDATASVPALLKLGSSRNDTLGNNTVAGSGDTCASIQMMGNDGTRFIDLARIDAVTDATPGTNDMPGRLVFSTTSDGGSAVTERMRIESTGSVVCAGDIFTGTSSALLTDTIHSRATTNDDSTSRIQFRPRNAAGGSSVQAEITVSGLFKFNSGYGSATTAYGVRAWVNFKGTGTVSIRNSGNVSSITDQGTGLYRINFSTAMVDANYSAVGSSGEDNNNTTPNNQGFQLQRNSPQTGSVGCGTTNSASTPTDHEYICCSVVR